MRSHLRPLLPLFVVLAAGYWIALFVGTHVPVDNLNVGINNLDKYMHCAAYGVLAFLISSVLIIWRGYQAKFPIWIWTLALVYGSIDEMTQRFVPSRSPDIIDLACDMIGATLGLLLIHGCVLAYRVWRSWRVTTVPEGSAS